jgi:hypothetical protein
MAPDNELTRQRDAFDSRDEEKGCSTERATHEGHAEGGQKTE